MKRLHNIYNKFISLDNFKLAYKKALKGKKNRKFDFINKFSPDLDNKLTEIIDLIKNKTYKAGPYNIFYVTRPKLRKICVAPFRDRIIHHALINILEERFEKYMIPNSFACRKGKGIDLALKTARKYCGKYKWFLKLDVTKYFDNIDHDLLYNTLNRLIKDKNVLWVIKNIIYSYNKNSTGVPIGNLTSQYFANIFLTGMDHFIKEQLKVKGYCRYMDDFIIFSDTKEELYNNLIKIKEYIYNKLKLSLHEPVINKVSNGIPFLGFRVYKNKIKLLKKSKQNFKNKLKVYCKKLEEDEIDVSEFKHSMFSVLGHVYRANSFNFIQNHCKKAGDLGYDFFIYSFYLHKCKFNINVKKNNGLSSVCC